MRLRKRSAHGRRTDGDPDVLLWIYYPPKSSFSARNSQGLTPVEEAWSKCTPGGYLDVPMDRRIRALAHSAVRLLHVRETEGSQRPEPHLGRTTLTLPPRGAGKHRLQRSPFPGALKSDDHRLGFRYGIEFGHEVGTPAVRPRRPCMQRGGGIHCQSDTPGKQARARGRCGQRCDAAIMLEANR